MLRLKLKEPYEEVFVGLSLENPLTGANTTVDAKIDTGAAITVVPMHMLDGMELEILGERELAMADGSPLHAVVCLCNVSLSDEDTFEMAVHAIKSKANIALIGMDILHKCNYAQWHDYRDGEDIIYFQIEQAEMPD